MSELSQTVSVMKTIFYKRTHFHIDIDNTNEICILCILKLKIAFYKLYG